MASEKRPPQQRRRRPPTVINLEATEVDPAASAARAAPIEPQAAEPPVAESAQPSASKPQTASKTEDVFIPPPAERPSPAAGGRGPSEPPPSDPPTGPVRRPIAWLPNSLSAALIGNGVAAVVGGLLVFALIWLTGALSRPRDAAVDLSPRLAAIERQL